MKGALRAIKNKSYSPVEVRVRDATANEKGPVPPGLMHKLAQDTYDMDDFPKLFAMLLKRLTDYDHSRHIFRALVVTDYLLRNGDERFVQKMKNHQRAITRLQDRRSVRVKSICDLADKIWKLLSDEKYLKEQRETAARMRPKLAGFSNQNYQNYMGMASSYSSQPAPQPTTASAPTSPQSPKHAKSESESEDESPKRRSSRRDKEGDDEDKKKKKDRKKKDEGEDEDKEKKKKKDKKEKEKGDKDDDEKEAHRKRKEERRKRKEKEAAEAAAAASKGDKDKEKEKDKDKKEKKDKKKKKEESESEEEEAPTPKEVEKQVEDMFDKKGADFDFLTGTGGPAPKGAPAGNWEEDFKFKEEAEPDIFWEDTKGNDNIFGGAAAPAEEEKEKHVEKSTNPFDQADAFAAEANRPAQQQQGQAPQTPKSPNASLLTDLVNVENMTQTREDVEKRRRKESQQRRLDQGLTMREMAEQNKTALPASFDLHELDLNEGGAKKPAAAAVPMAAPAGAQQPVQYNAYGLPVQQPQHVKRGSASTMNAMVQQQMGGPAMMGQMGQMGMGGAGMMNPAMMNPAYQQQMYQQQMMQQQMYQQQMWAQQHAQQQQQGQWGFGQQH